MENSEFSQKDFCERLTTLPLAKPFLGREYLTWLWYTAETNGEGLSIEDPAGSKPWTVDLWVDDRILLQSWDMPGHENLLRGGDPSHSQEASASLATGKVVREMRVGMHVRGVGDFTCTLNADSLSPRSLRLPTDQGEGDDAGSIEEFGPEAWVSSRLLYLEIFLGVTDSLFARFMSERNNKDWEQDGLTRLRQWISERQTGESSKKLLH